MDTESTNYPQPAAPAPVEDLDISRATPEFWAALAEAQGEIENASKNQTNKHLSSKYADLASILSEIRGPFSKHGLALTQYPTRDSDARVVVTTITSHKGGGLVLSNLRLRPAKEFAHDIGAIITYLRRYAAAAAAGIAQEDEDGMLLDASAADGYGGSQEQRAPQRQQQGPRQPQRKQREDTPAQQQGEGEEQRTTNRAEEGMPTNPWGDDLSTGQRTLIQAKAKAAGMSDATLLERFGTIGAADVNAVLKQLKNATGGEG